MANTIKIKRGLSSNISNATLEQGELAITTDTQDLYVGTDSGNIKIGGISYSDTNAKTLIAGPASSIELGGLKVRYDSTTQTLYIRNDGSNA